MGFTELHKSPYGLVRFYRTVSPVHRSSSPGMRGLKPRIPIERERCSLLSVALSIASPLLGVTQHPALWSPDFPHPVTMDFGRDHLLNSSLTIGYHKMRIQCNPCYEHPLVAPQLVHR